MLNFCKNITNVFHLLTTANAKLNSIFNDTLKKLYFTLHLDNALPYLTGIPNGYTIMIKNKIIKLKSRFSVQQFISIQFHWYWLIMKFSVEQAFVMKTALKQGNWSVCHGGMETWHAVCAGEVAWTQSCDIEIRNTRLQCCFWTSCVHLPTTWATALPTISDMIRAELVRCSGHVHEWQWVRSQTVIPELLPETTCREWYDMSDCVNLIELRSLNLTVSSSSEEYRNTIVL